MNFNSNLMISESETPVYYSFLKKLLESLSGIAYTTNNYASLAQWLEHRICNARVVGSNPTGG